MKRIFVLIGVLFGFGCGLHAQAAAPVDVNVCDVVKSPASFDGKMVRIKGTVVAGFDEFVIKDATDPNCGFQVNAIWLSYPQGSKAKSGPAAIVTAQPAHNFAGTLKTPGAHAGDTGQEQGLQAVRLAACADAPEGRGHVPGVRALRGDGDADRTPGYRGRCDDEARCFGQDRGPGRIRQHERLSRAAGAGIGVRRDAEGDRLFEDRRDHEGRCGDKRAARLGRRRRIRRSLCRGSAAGGAHGSRSGGRSGQGGRRAVSQAEGAEWRERCVCGVGNEAMPEGQGTKDSPDGVLYNCVFNRDHLQGNAIVYALFHIGHHISDMRSPKAADQDSPFIIDENNAWVITSVAAIVSGQKYLTLPGGYLFYNAAWPMDAARGQDGSGAEGLPGQRGAAEPLSSAQHRIGERRWPGYGRRLSACGQTARSPREGARRARILESAPQFMSRPYAGEKRKNG